jgi:dTDP-4-dehydrorhamnose 3,5-epimerase
MSNIKSYSELLPEVYLIDLQSSEDSRGRFIKTFHAPSFKELAPGISIEESFYTVSHADVLRGMHFQSGASAHSKIVRCSKGSALDVVVDVRQDSPFFNKPVSIILSEDKDQSILIGKGYAHGFLSLSEFTVMEYFTSSIHDPINDNGVLWSSIDFDWPIENPIVSQRDQLHPLLGRDK